MVVDQFVRRCLDYYIWLEEVFSVLRARMDRGNPRIKRRSYTGKRKLHYHYAVTNITANTFYYNLLQSDPHKNPAKLGTFTRSPGDLILA